LSTRARIRSTAIVGAKHPPKSHASPLQRTTITRCTRLDMTMRASNSRGGEWCRVARRALTRGGWNGDGVCSGRMTSFVSCRGNPLWLPNSFWRFTTTRAGTGACPYASVSGPCWAMGIWARFIAPLRNGDSAVNATRSRFTPTQTYPPEPVMWKL